MVQAVMRAFVGRASLTYRQGALLILTAGVMFSFTPILFRGVEAATDWQFVAVRGASMAVVLLAVTRLRAGDFELAQVTGRSLLAGVLLALMSLMFILALARTTAALVTFMLAAAPISGAIFGWIVLRERVRFPTGLAVVVTLAGVGIMVSSGIEAGQTSGVVLAALIPVFMGLYNVLVRSSGEAMDPIVPGIVSGIVLALVAGGVALGGSGLSLPVRDVLLGFMAGGIVLGVGLPMFNLGHRSVPTAQVSLLNLTEVVLAPLWVWIWPGEVPSAGTLAGGAIVLAAVIYLVLASDRALRLASP